MFDRILIVGGAGFIGSHLASKILAKGKKVTILDSLTPQVHGQIPKNIEWLEQQGIDFIRGNVVKRADWGRALHDVDAIVHLAAETGTGQSMYQIAHYNEVNTQATALLFDVLGQLPEHRVKRIILASSRSVYGEGAYHCHHCDQGRVFPKSRALNDLMRGQWELICPNCAHELMPVATTETDPVLPASIYAATKYAQEDLVRIACESQGIDYAIFRLQNVYGERQSLNNPYTGLLSIFSTKIRLSNPLPLFEDGNESRDFVHVDDVTDALLCGLFSKKPTNTIINVGSGIPTSVNDVAIQLACAFGREPNIVVTGQYRVGDIRHNVADITRLMRYFDFKPKISLQEGLGRFAAWVASQPIPEDKGNAANNELRDRNLMN